MSARSYLDLAGLEAAVLDARGMGFGDKLCAHPRQVRPINKSTAAEPRDQLKQTAERLFAERGFHRLSLRQLAAEVGLHPDSLYAHFDSKDSLLQELIEDGYDALLEGARASLHQAPRDGALEALVRNHLAFRRAHPCWFFLAAMERRHLAAPRQAEILCCERDYEGLFVGALSIYTDSDDQRTRAAVRQLLRLLDAVLLHDEASGTPPQPEDWASDLAWLAVQRLADRALAAPGRLMESE